MELDDDEEPPTDEISQALGSFYASLGVEEESAAARSPVATPTPTPPPRTYQTVSEAAGERSGNASPCNEGSNSPGPSGNEEEKDKRKKKVRQ